ncbi:hypothetical protein TorRG33x02_290800 [Trema orientale]|uniref:Uncharacterized protein n=1 Tax=Trema orientale TaxID=63057 RepID=A0A2P5CC71_TREOI|nr:hypothetical protein TorRG33x02_290800 [Trema orientale]
MGWVIILWTLVLAMAANSKRDAKTLASCLQYRVESLSLFSLLAPFEAITRDFAFSKSPPTINFRNNCYILPLVSPTLDDAVADLNKLDWRECFNTSIQTISPTVTHRLVISSTATHPVLKHHSSADCSNKRRTKRKAISEIGNHGGFLAPPRGTAAVLIRRIGQPKKVPRTKRTTPHIKSSEEEENDFAAFLCFI